MDAHRALESLRRFAEMTDLEFYEEFLEDASLEELGEFCREFPDFLEEDARKANEELMDIDSDAMFTQIKDKLAKQGYAYEDK